MDTSRLAERLKKVQDRKKGGGSKNFFKSPKDGSHTSIRQVPYPHNEDNMPFIEVGWHYNVAGHRSLVCPQETFGTPCPICDLAEQFLSMGGKENWQIYKKLSAKLRYYSPIIIRGQDEPEVKLWGYGTTIYEELLEKFLNPKWGNLADPVEGRDIEVWTIPKGKAGNDTDFDKPKMDVEPSPSKLLEKKSDMAELIKTVPNYLEDEETFPVKSFNELKTVVAKLADIEVPEDVNLEVSEPSVSSEVVEDLPEKDNEGDTSGGDDELDQELADLLGGGS